MTCEGFGASSAWYWHETGMAAVFGNVRSEAKQTSSRPADISVFDPYRHQWIRSDL
jgi:hypothetical protein